MSDSDSDAESQSGPHFCPMPYRYGVLRVDAVETVKHLNDPVATAQAAALQTKEYLVYLDEELELPFPDRPWFRFIVGGISDQLRYHDTTHSFTPDMCAPIHPNTDHPANRPPLRTVPDFPLPHCYHWMGTNIHVRIRAKPDDEGFDDGRAIRLPAEERITMQMYWTDDMNTRYERLVAARAAANGEERPTASPVATLGLDVIKSRDIVEPMVADGTSSSLGNPTQSLEHPPTGRESLCSYTATDDSASMASGEALADTGVFGGDPDYDAEFLPIVDFDFSLDRMLSAERIPSPYELIEERNTLVRIIKEAHVRERSARPLSPAAEIARAERARMHLRAQGSPETEKQEPSQHNNAPDVTTNPASQEQNISGVHLVRATQTFRERTGLFIQKIRYKLRLPYLHTSSSGPKAR